MHKLLFAHWRNCRQQQNPEQQLKVLTVNQCLTHLQYHTHQNTKTKVDSHTEQHRKSLTTLKQPNRKYIENSRIMTLIIVRHILRTKFLRRSIFLLCITLLQNHFLWFFNNSSIKCTIIIFYIPLRLTLHFLMTQRHSHTYPQQILYHRSLCFYLTISVLKGMPFNFGYLVRMCS